jgi:hypothetical protein
VVSVALRGMVDEKEMVVAKVKYVRPATVQSTPFIHGSARDSVASVASARTYPRRD